MVHRTTVAPSESSVITEPSMTWQPIETAPRDGSLILIGGMGSRGWFVADVKWRDGWMMWSSETDDWTEECHAASHWMPLPAPPTGQP